MTGVVPSTDFRIYWEGETSNIRFTLWVQICNRVLCALVYFQPSNRLSVVECFILVMGQTAFKTLIHKENTVLCLRSQNLILAWAAFWGLFAFIPLGWLVDSNNQRIIYTKDIVNGLRIGYGSSPHTTHGIIKYIRRDISTVQLIDFDDHNLVLYIHFPEFHRTIGLLKILNR